MVFRPKQRALGDKYKNFVFLVFISILFFYGISLGMSNYISLFLNEMGIPKNILRNIIQIEIFGALLIAPILMKLSESFGVSKIIFSALIIRNITILALTISSDIKVAMVLMLLLGLSDFCIFSLLWFWMISILPKKNKKLISSILYSSLMFGISLSVIWLYKKNSFALDSPFYYSSFAGFVALFLVYFVKDHSPILRPASNMSKPSKMIKFIMIPTLAILVSSYLYQSLSRFIPAYFIPITHDFDVSMKILYSFVVGNILATPAIALLQDRFGKRLSFIIISTLLISILFVLIPFIINLMTLVYFAFFIVGGFAGIFFILAIDEIDAKFDGRNFLMAIIIVSLMYQIGGFSGLFVTGAAMEYWGNTGFIISTSIVSFFFLLYIIYHLNNEKAK